MGQFFDVDHSFFSIWGYPMSILELLATISGAVAIWLSAKENIWSWILGLVNVIAAFWMFYQIQLYPDMFLQIFFFITNIVGFWQWKFPKEAEANTKMELRISRTKPVYLILIAVTGGLFTWILGTFSSHLHQIAPSLFNLPSSFPYADSFTTVLSVLATFMLIRKKVEAWWIWIIVDIISAYLYFVKDVKLYAFLYLGFVIIAILGAMEWTRKYLANKRTNTASF